MNPFVVATHTKSMTPPPPRSNLTENNNTVVDISHCDPQRPDSYIPRPPLPTCSSAHPARPNLLQRSSPKKHSVRHQTFQYTDFHRLREHMAVRRRGDNKQQTLFLTCFNQQNHDTPSHHGRILLQRNFAQKTPVYCCGCVRPTFAPTEHVAVDRLRVTIPGSRGFALAIIAPRPIRCRLLCPFNTLWGNYFLGHNLIFTRLTRGERVQEAVSLCLTTINFLPSPTQTVTSWDRLQQSCVFSSYIVCSLDAQLYINICKLLAGYSLAGPLHHKLVRGLYRFSSTISHTLEILTTSQERSNKWLTRHFAFVGDNPGRLSRGTGATVVRYSIHSPHVGTSCGLCSRVQLQLTDVVRSI